MITTAAQCSPPARITEDGVAETLSAKTIHQADELAGLLRDGALPRLGLVDVGRGSRLAFELAVRVTLADLTRFTARACNGHAVDADRWQQLREDLERLYRMAVAARAPRAHA